MVKFWILFAFLLLPLAVLTFPVTKESAARKGKHQFPILPDPWQLEYEDPRLQRPGATDVRGRLHRTTTLTGDAHSRLLWHCSLVVTPEQGSDWKATLIPLRTVPDGAMPARGDDPKATEATTVPAIFREDSVVRVHSDGVPKVTDATTVPVTFRLEDTCVRKHGARIRKQTDAAMGPATLRGDTAVRIHTVTTTVSAIIRENTVVTEHDVTESRLLTLVCRCLTILTVDADTVETAVAESCVQLSLVVLSKLHVITLRRVAPVQGGLYHVLKVHHFRTINLCTSFEIIRIVKHYVNAYKARCFHICRTKLDLAASAIRPSLFKYRNNSIIYYHRRCICRLMDAVINNVRTCIRVSFAPKHSSSHFSMYCGHVVNIVCFLVSVCYVKNYLCKKVEKTKNTKPSEIFDNAGFSTGSDNAKHQSDGCFHSITKSRHGQNTSILSDILHHTWRFGQQRMSNLLLHTSATPERRAHTKSPSPTSSTLRSVREHLAPDHLTRTKEGTGAVTESSLSTFSPEDTGFPGQSVINNVYPVTRFLPDSTRNPSQDLVHVGYRLATLGALPAEVTVSRVRLANAGFYSRGVGDEVTCYSCHVRHSGWTRGDNPMEVHRRLSPHCPHVQQSEEASAALPPTAAATDTPGGAVVNGDSDASGHGHVHGTGASVLTNGHEEDSEGPSPTAPSEHTGTVPDAAAQNSAQRRQNTEHQSTTPGRGTESSPATETAVTSRSGHNPSAVTSRTGGTSSPTSPNTGADTRQSGSVVSNPGTPAGGERSEAVEHPTPTTTTTTTGSSVTATTDASRQRTNENPPRPLFPRAALDLGGAVYPMYQNMNGRRQSFPRWDETRAPPLLDIILNGMFYAGYSDCVRCFYCGVGLKNWVVTDDVWAEHVRWRADCQYLRAIKGDDFIRNTQRRLGIENSEDTVAPNSSRTSPSAPETQQRQQQQQQQQQQQPHTSAPAITTTATASRTATGISTTAATVATPPPPPPPPAAVSGSAGHPDVRTSGPAATQEAQPRAADFRGSEGAGGAGAVASSRTRPASGSTTSISSNSRRSVSEGRGSGGAEGTSGGAGFNAASSVTDQETAAATTPSSSQQPGNRTQTRNYLCRVCQRARVDTILLPCGHIVACETCARSVTSCPLCSRHVQATARVLME